MPFSIDPSKNETSGQEFVVYSSNSDPAVTWREFVADAVDGERKNKRVVSIVQFGDGRFGVVYESIVTV